MQRNLAPKLMLLAVVVLTTLWVLVTSSSSMASSSASGSPALSQLQQITPTTTEPDGSVAGSTDGIVSMGVVIALIVLVPMLVSRVLWARHIQ